MRNKTKAYHETKELFENRSMDKNIDDAIQRLEKAYYALYALAKLSPKMSDVHLSGIQFIANKAQKVGEAGKCLEGIADFVLADEIHLM